MTTQLEVGASPGGHRVSEGLVNLEPASCHYSTLLRCQKSVWKSPKPSYGSHQNRSLPVQDGCGARNRKLQFPESHLNNAEIKLDLPIWRVCHCACPGTGSSNLFTKDYPKSSSNVSWYAVGRGDSQNHNLRFKERAQCTSKMEEKSLTSADNHDDVTIDNEGEGHEI